VIIPGYPGEQEIRQKFLLFSPLIGHFWPIKGIFGQEDCGVTLFVCFIYEDYRPLVVIDTLFIAQSSEAGYL